MHLPDCRSINSDTPTHPGISWSAGMTSSRICAIPASMDEGRASIVIERAYTIHTLFSSFRGGAPVAPPVHSQPCSDGSGVAMATAVVLGRDWQANEAGP
jgi:hypothetical protein